MEGIILVTPEQLNATAEQFRTKGNAMAELMRGMISDVQRLSSTWEGEASTAFIAKFNKFEEDMTQMNNMINEHVNDLNQMADIYKSTEDQNLSDISALAENVIS